MCQSINIWRFRPLLTHSLTSRQYQSVGRRKAVNREFATMSLEIKEKNHVFMGYFWDLASDDAEKRVNAGRLIIGKLHINLHRNLCIS